MANNRTLEAVISIAGAIDPSLARSLNNATRQFSGLKLGVAAVSTAAVAATSAVVAFGASAVNSAMEFEQQMQNVASLLEGSTAQISKRTKELGEDVIEVSNKTGVSTDELSDGLYKIISAVGDSKDAITQMELAAKVAKAGGTETTEAINLLTAVTKGYNDTSGEAFQKAADLAFMTDKLGQTSVPELASSIGKVIPLSAALGVEQEELFGAFAALTGVTGSTAEVATQMKAVMSGLMSPTDDMTKKLQSLGYANANAALESLGFQGVLDALGGTVGGDTQALAKLFSSVEAQTAILALAGAQSEDLTEKTQAMYDASGAMESAFKTRTATLKNTIAVIKNLGKNFVTNVGNTILPMVSDLATKALPKIEAFLDAATPKVIDFFQQASTRIKEVYDFTNTNIVPIISTVADAMKLGFDKANEVFKEVYDVVTSVFDYLAEHKTILTVLAVAVGTVATAIGAYLLIQNASAIAYAVLSAAITTYTTVTGIATTVSSAFGAVMAFLTSPVTLVILAIGALIAAGVALYQNWDVVKLKATEIWEHLKAFANGVKETFVNAFSGLAGIVATPINGIISLVNGAIDSINAISIDIPDWVPGLGGKNFSLSIPKIPMFADGGFTNGISIAGEAGTEAVISFNKAVRAENLSYWAQAGRMLGVSTDAISSLLGGGSSGNVNNITYSPNITVNGNASKADIIEALREHEEEFMDMLDDFFNGRGPAYGS